MSLLHVAYTTLLIMFLVFNRFLLSSISVSPLLVLSNHWLWWSNHCVVCVCVCSTLAPCTGDGCGCRWDNRFQHHCCQTKHPSGASQVTSTHPPSLLSLYQSMCVCVYVCICVFMCLCLCVFMYIYVFVCLCMCVCVYVCVFVFFMYACVWVCLCLFMCLCVCVGVLMYICVCVCV